MLRPSKKEKEKASIGVEISTTITCKHGFDDNFT
jgi:hypothetical protein